MNDEKLVTILTQLQQDVSSLKEDISVIKRDVANVKNDVIKVRTTQENTVVPHIKLLAEGYGSLQEKLDNLAEVSPIPDMKDDIDIMQKAITSIAKAK